jgi:hypothetical protein
MSISSDLQGFKFFNWRKQLSTRNIDQNLVTILPVQNNTLQGERIYIHLPRDFLATGTKKLSSRTIAIQ